MDRWPSGRRRTIGNRVYLQRVPRVRIPFCPPFQTKPPESEVFCYLEIRYLSGKAIKSSNLPTKLWSAFSIIYSLTLSLFSIVIISAYLYEGSKVPYIKIAISPSNCFNPFFILCQLVKIGIFTKSILFILGYR